MKIITRKILYQYFLIEHSHIFMIFNVHIAILNSNVGCPFPNKCSWIHPWLELNAQIINEHVSMHSYRISISLYSKINQGMISNVIYTNCKRWNGNNQMLTRQVILLPIPDWISKAKNQQPVSSVICHSYLPKIVSLKMLQHSYSQASEKQFFPACY